MRMTMTPVSASPAMMARAIGAAPRQRGSSEAWRLRQPSARRIEERLRQDLAVGDDDADIGGEVGEGCRLLGGRAASPACGPGGRSASAT